MDLSFLPPINASLNALAAVLLCVGLVRIRRRDIRGHRRVMISAFAVSSLFLALYVAHKVWRGFESTTFHAGGEDDGLFTGERADRDVQLAFYFDKAYRDFEPTESDQTDPIGGS